MSDKCKFCGAKMLSARFDTNYYECITSYCIETGQWLQSLGCIMTQRDNLEAEVKRLRDEDDTPPMDERLAHAGKLFRQVVAEREEMRREVQRLRDFLNEVSEELIDSLTMAETTDVMAGWIPTEQIYDISNKLIEALTEAKQ